MRRNNDIINKTGCCKRAKPWDSWGVCFVKGLKVMKVKKFFIIFAFIAAAAFLICRYAGMFNAGGFRSTEDTAETDDFCMGTLAMQKVYGNKARLAASETAQRFREIEEMMSASLPGSEIGRLNALAGKGGVNLSSETFGVLETSIKYARLSGGAFDVTVGPLVKAWAVTSGEPRVPEPDEVGRLIELVDYKSMLLDRTCLSAKLEKPGQMVDLGGIAKGFAADEAIRIYRKYGIKSAYVNLGGNIAVLGRKPDGSLWRIGIQNPRAERGKHIGILEVSDKAVVTSGDYERYFEKDGRRYHHIIDPKTGYPADSGIISATIAAEASIDADALSTAVFVLGLDRGMELIGSLEGVEGIFITDDKKVYVTEGLKKDFRMADSSGEFKYVEKR